MGDVAMTIPVLLAFRDAYPDTKITILTKPFFLPFFSQIPNLKVKIFETETTHKGVWGIRKLAKELKTEEIDAIADLHNVLRTNILKNIFYFSGIPFKQINKGRTEKKMLTRWENKIFKPLKTTHERYIDVFKELNFNLNFNTKKYFLKKEILSTEMQKLIGANTQKWIGIAPFAAHQGKVYPIEQLIKVIAALDRSNDYKIILLGGGADETKKLLSVEQKFENALSIAGKLSLKEELNLISNLDIMVSMDSGNGHLAAMYGVPVVTIWGVTHPYAGFRPYNQPEKNSLIPDLTRYPKIPTSIYGNKYPEGYEQAMHSISSQTILDKIIEIV